MAHARRKVATGLVDSGDYLKIALALDSRSRAASLSSYEGCINNAVQNDITRPFAAYIGPHTGFVSSGRNLKSLAATSRMPFHN